MNEMAKWRRRFVISVCVVLIVPAFLKVVSLAERSPVLSACDPVFPWLHLETSLQAAVIFEIGIASLMFARRTEAFALAFSGWHVGLFAFLPDAGFLTRTVPANPCKCLGTLSGWTGRSGNPQG